MPRAKKRYADNPAYQISLNDEQLQVLGKIFAVWGQIDFQVIAVIASIMEISHSAAVSLLDNVTSGTLIGYLRKSLSKVKSEEDRKELKEFCERMGALVEKRNHLSHGIWGWETYNDEKSVRPACHYNRAEAAFPFTALEDLCRQIMAESHAISDVMRRYHRIQPNPNHETSPFYFGKSGGKRPRETWYATTPLQPGKDHHKPG